MSVDRNRRAAQDAREVDLELARTLVAVVAAFCEGTIDRAFDPSRAVGHEVRDRRRFLLEDRAQGHDLVGPTERFYASYQLVKTDADREQIGARIERVTERLLG